jgi:hypothetical protein
MKTTHILTLALSALVPALPALESNIIAVSGDVHAREITDTFDDAAKGHAEVLETRACSTRAATDKLMFQDSMATFSAARSKKSPSCYDWNSDECTGLPFLGTPDEPYGYKFKPSCRRHDFGYQNFRREGRCNATNKKKIDDQFKRDLYDVCSKYSGLLHAWEGVRCRRIADAYHVAVRNLGDC